MFSEREQIEKDPDEFDIYNEDPIEEESETPPEDGSEDFYEEPVKDPEPVGKITEFYNDIYRFYYAYYTETNPETGHVYEKKTEVRYNPFTMQRKTYYWDSTGDKRTSSQKVNDGGFFELVGRMVGL
uniref:Uncharacterized protein n=1 Tax=Strombidium inclinatum TaxID=197538 RepID=A0A7S3N3Y1_9SPIT|mmetsp:Transcript_8433/g.12860  ORF Transcript_8433/g.12860 Transcript_8433/m.12860 type:complete len:127 (+) Transcript_8433:2580-2960(+)